MEIRDFIDLEFGGMLECLDRLIRIPSVRSSAEPGAPFGKEARRVLEETPPELASDIFLNGVVMTGGGSLIYGIDRYLADVLSVPVSVAERAEECVGVGTGESLQFIS